ncbi:MAG: DUF3160 domain-containing protein [Myxococcales bacterium]|nr:DUF3160 domain-containing protein [Myxococcales bacterium]
MNARLFALTLLCAAPAAAAPDTLGDPTRLTDAALSVGDFAFSPDGKTVVFAAGAAGARDLYSVPVAGGAPTRLTDDPGDDRDPTFDQNGAHLIWSSNRGATGYDLWRAKADGSDPKQITTLPEDALEPAVSPLRYQLFAVIDDACSGAVGERVSLYEKIAFTRQKGDSREVWFTSVKGRHRGRLSPEGASCGAPVWSGDGLSVGWTCSAGGPVAHDTRAEWIPSFESALAALKGGEGCETDPKGWRSDACLKKLPRTYATHAPQATPPGVSAQGYSANQILQLGVGASGAPMQRPRANGGAWVPMPLSAKVQHGPIWSPRGEHVAWVADGGLFVAPARYRLQTTLNLFDFPELWRAGVSALLAKNHFVARPGAEKEFFTLYEKARYARRPTFVTADAALQVFHDEFAALLKRAEADAMEALRLMSNALAAHFATRADDPLGRYLAVYFAVPAAVLEAAPEIDEGFDPYMAPEDKPAPPLEQLKANLPRALAKVPAPIRDEVKGHVDRMLAHAGIAEVAVPGGGSKKVDYSQFQVRGHYTGSGLAGYFLAMNWYALLPVPLEGAGPVLDALQAPRSDGKPNAYAEWAKVDALGGAFLGKPIDGTPAHLVALKKEKPALLQPGQAKALGAALAAKVGPIPLRGLSGTLEGKDRVAGLRLFPKRFGVDASFIGRLTYPTLKHERGWPNPVEIFAALGSERATALARAAAKDEAKGLGDAFLKDWEAALAKLQAEHGRGDDGLAQTDLYHAWLALLRTLAAQHGVRPPARLHFARSDAWGDRLLFSALAGYTQLKHDAVLYAAQEYGAECDGAAPVMGFVEQPELPDPVGFVDPLPTFFEQMATLGDRVYGQLAGGKAPRVRSPWGGDDAKPLNAKVFAETLAGLAKKEIEGRPFTRDEVKWLRDVGGVMEALFLGLEKSPDLMFGNDQGRQQRGVTLVTDVYTNVTSNQVLQLGVGKLLDLFVVVPGPTGHRVTQGGLFSFYAFRQPMSDRLTDEAWWQWLESGDVPALPAWTKSFVEPAPK